MNRLFIAALLMTALTGCTSAQNDEVALKPRIVVLTDIGPADVEPDDNESAVRLMAYADRFEIEALITTIGWNCDPYPPEWAEYLHRVVDAYEQDVPNLMKRSAQDGFLPLEQEQGSQELGYWPSAGYLRSRTVYGSPKAGIGVIGEDNDTPGTSIGFWKDRNKPDLARSFTDSPVISFPSNTMLPPVILYLGLPMSAYPSVDFPVPLGPIST